MRIDVKKYLFLGPQVDKELFFKEAQKAGIVEFINPEGKRKPTLSDSAHKFTHAIKIVRHYPLDNQEIRHDVALGIKVRNEVLEIKEKKDRAEEELQKIQQRIAMISPFGYFSFETIQELEKLTSRKLHFYCGKTSKHLIDVDEELILINSLDGIDYFIAFKGDHQKDERIFHRDLFEEHFPTSLEALQ